MGPRTLLWSALIYERNQFCVQGAAFLSHRRSDFEFEFFALNANTKAAAWLRQATVRPRVAIGRAQRGCISNATLAETALCRARHKQVYADPRTMPSIAVFPSIFRDLYVGDSA